MAYYTCKKRNTKGDNKMLGAVIGDIVGSRFEWDNIKSKKFEFFHNDCFFTDDTVMTLAVGSALSECNGNYENLSNTAIKNMQRIGRLYPDCGYGLRFEDWLYEDNPKPYNSFGNGAAMRVSLCAYFAESMNMAEDLSYKVTCISHNHEEGIKGAQATAVATFMARNGFHKDDIKNYILQHYYKIDFTLDKIRRRYSFDETCQGTVPYALQAFFESENFEDAIRNAISIGGDSDTMGAITGAVAGAYYGIDGKTENMALKFLDKFLIQIYHGIKQQLG